MRNVALNTFFVDYWSTMYRNAFGEDLPDASVLVGKDRQFSSRQEILEVECKIRFNLADLWENRSPSQDSSPLVMLDEAQRDLDDAIILRDLLPVFPQYSECSGYTGLTGDELSQINVWTCFTTKYGAVTIYPKDGSAMREIFFVADTIKSLGEAMGLYLHHFQNDFG